MSSVEDRTRAAMDAITAQVDGAPPLPLPPPHGRGARRHRGTPAPHRPRGPWLAPAAAAAAMIALAASLVIVRNGPTGRPAPPAPAGSADTVPEYYAALPGNAGGQTADAPDALVGDTFSGKRLATVPAPAGWWFVSVAAAADDRTFVVGAAQNRSSVLATRWYLIRLTPGSASFATLSELPIPAPQASFTPNRMALSPDGAMLALMDSGAAGGPPGLRVYSTATGAMVHAWSTPSLSQKAASTTEVSSLSWTSDGLAFQTLGSSLGIRLLQVSDPGHDLFADSRLAWSMPAPPVAGHPAAKRPFGCGGVPGPSILVAGDGKTMVCGASGVFRVPGDLGESTCPAAPAWNDEGVLEYSTATGKLTGTLYRTESECVPDAAGPVQLLWASRSGGAVIGYFEFAGLNLDPDRSVIRFGLFTRGKFTPLPAPPTITTDPTFTAW